MSHGVCARGRLRAAPFYCGQEPFVARASHHKEAKCSDVAYT
jgi:hypothetical protein